MNFASNIFNTSALKIEKYSDKEFLDYVENEIKEILNQEFKNDPAKRELKKTHHDFNFACPFCGDSATLKHKKRAHVMFDGKFAGFFKCFNCGKFMSVSNFLKSFGHAMSLSGIDYVKNHYEEKIGYDYVATQDASAMFNKSEFLNWSIPRDLIKERLRLVEINDPRASEAREFLTKRCQNMNRKNFLYDPSGRWLIIMNMIENSVIGAQVRDLTMTRKSKYKALTIEKLRKTLLGDTQEIPRDIMSMSLMFNVFQIDLMKKVIVTEGPLDSFLVPNAIATCGAGNKPTIEVPLNYLFDNDDPGRKYAVKHLKNNDSVFLWSKFMRDYDMPARKKWDVNDVLIWFNQTGLNFKNIQWHKYFSNDPLDILDI